MTVVIYHSEPDGCWAESPDQPGFSAAADTLPQLRRQVRAAIAEILGRSADLDERFEPKAVLGDTQIAIAGGRYTMVSGSTSGGTAAQVQRATTHPRMTPPRPAAV